MSLKLQLRGAGSGPRWMDAFIPPDPPDAARFLNSLGEWAVPFLGTRKKYTIGPSWAGQQYPTIGDAVSAAVDEGHGNVNFGGVLFDLYPGYYQENVVIPVELRSWQFLGAGNYNDTYIDSLTIHNAATRTNWTLANLGLSYLNVDQAGTSTKFGQLRNVATWQDVSVNSPNLQWQMWGGGFLNGTKSRTLVTDRASFHNVPMTGTGGTLTASITSLVGNTRVMGCEPIFGRLYFAGRGIVMVGCFQEHNGSPAVTDACQVVSFCQGNTFSHNAGPSGPVWVQTPEATSNFHDGGNNFTEGQQYPWYQLSGTRSDRAESDNELRRVINVSGSPILTPAQVGSQRKTTIAKTDGGGIVTLPLLETVEPGCTLLLKDAGGNATAAPITFSGDGGQLIDGGPSLSLSTNYAAVEVQAGPSQWMVLARYL